MTILFLGTFNNSFIFYVRFWSRSHAHVWTIYNYQQNVKYTKYPYAVVAYGHFFSQTRFMAHCKSILRSRYIVNKLEKIWKNNYTIYVCVVF